MFKFILSFLMFLGLGFNYSQAEWVTVELTAYSLYENSNSITASGTVPVQGRTIAVNWLPIGTRVQIFGNWYVVEDRGGMEGIDIFFDSYDDCIQFGRQVAEIYIER